MDDKLFVVLGLGQVPWLLSPRAIKHQSSGHCQPWIALRSLMVLLALATLGISSPIWTWALVSAMALLVAASYLLLLARSGHNFDETGAINGWMSRLSIALGMAFGLAGFCFIPIFPASFGTTRAGVAICLAAYLWGVVRFFTTTYGAAMKVSMTLSRRQRDRVFGSLLLLIGFTTLGMLARCVGEFEPKTGIVTGSGSTTLFAVASALWLLSGIAWLRGATTRPTRPYLYAGELVGISSLALLLVGISVDTTHQTISWKVLEAACGPFLAVLLFESLGSNLVAVQNRRRHSFPAAPAAIHASIAAAAAVGMVAHASLPYAANENGWPWLTTQLMFVASYCLYTLGAVAFSRTSKRRSNGVEHVENSATFNLLHDATYYWAAWMVGILIPIAAGRYIDSTAVAEHNYWWWILPVLSLVTAVVATPLSTFLFAHNNIRDHLAGLDSLGMPSSLGEAIRARIRRHTTTQLFGLVILMFSGWVTLILPRLIDS